MTLKAPTFKLKSVTLKAPKGSTGDQLSGIFSAIIGLSLFAATVPLIGAVTN